MKDTLRLRERHFVLFGASADDGDRVFQLVRAQLAGATALRLLSFGASSDAFALRRHFPDAFIKGIERDAAAIALCTARRARANDINMSFAVAGSAVGEAARSYDAVFCLGQHPAPRFEDFERAVMDLARCLKPGGLLALHPGAFQFQDTAAARHFASVAPLVFRKGG
jgi:SAM-dependent methyltransferase